MARPGLYANIHAKRKRGGKMRKKGAKDLGKAAMKKGGIAKLNPGLKAFMKKKMAKKK